MPPAGARARWGWPALVWLLSRAAVISVWMVWEPWASGDVHYYWTRMSSLLAGDAGVGETMPEYPTPVLWLLLLPAAFSGSTADGFQTAFLVMMVSLDLLFTVMLWWGGRGRAAVWFWIVFVLALGPIVYFRLDLVPAAAVGLALLALARGADGWAGGLLALGAGLKLWPGTLYPTTVRGSRHRDHRVTISFAVTGVVLVIAAVLYGGWARLLSPLQWQEGRGLQIESLWATVAMIQRVLDPAQYVVRYSRFQAYEIFGPSTQTWLSISSAATIGGYLLILLGYVLWFGANYPTVFSRRPRLVDAAEPAPAAAVGLFMVAVIMITLITNKTFSPQYLTWLGAALAALVAVSPPTGSARRTAIGAAIVTIPIAVLTQVIYPLGYGSLLQMSADTATLTAVLAVRNIAVLLLGLWLMWRFVQVLRRRVGQHRELSAASADL